MKKLGNRGVTSLEMLISFIIVSAIVVSLFDVIMNYRNKQQIESIKNSVIAYSNNIQKVIQDDLIKKHVSNVNVAVDQKSSNFNLGNSEETRLEIDSINNKIRYGKITEMINYPIPEIFDLSLSSDSKIEYITGNVNFVKITIILEHPNFKNNIYSFEIIAPINFSVS